MKKIINLGILTGLLVSIGLFFLPGLIFGATAPTETLQQVKYVPMAPIPGLTDGSGTNPTSLSDFLANVFNWVIMLCGLLAVIFIFYGGFKYAAEESIFGKADAKKTIENALYGLGLALASWFLLNLINPQLLLLKVSDIPNERVTFESGGLFGSTDVTAELKAIRQDYDLAQYTARAIEATDPEKAKAIMAKAEIDKYTRTTDLNVSAAKTATDNVTSRNIEQNIYEMTQAKYQENTLFSNISDPEAKKAAIPGHLAKLEMYNQNQTYLNLKKEVLKDGTIDEAIINNENLAIDRKATALATELRAIGELKDAENLQKNATEIIAKNNALKNFK